MLIAVIAVEHMQLLYLSVKKNKQFHFPSDMLLGPWLQSERMVFLCFVWKLITLVSVLPVVI